MCCASRPAYVLCVQPGVYVLCVQPRAVLVRRGVEERRADAEGISKLLTAAHALRRVPGGRHRRRGFRSVLHVGEDDALCANVQDALHDDRVVPRHAHDRLRVARLRRLQLEHDVAELVGRVLGVGVGVGRRRGYEGVGKVRRADSKERSGA